MRSLFIYLGAAGALLLASCTNPVTPSPKPQLSLPAVGADMVSIATAANLGLVLVQAENPSAIPANVSSTIQQAVAALEASGQGLEQGNLTTGDLAANVTALDRAYQSAVAGLQTFDPTDAAKLAAIRAEVLAAVATYNAAASAYNAAEGASLPILPVPTDGGHALLLAHFG